MCQLDKNQIQNMNTTDKLSFIAIGISVMTAVFSWYSFSKTDELSRNGFNRSYRPYITASNFSYINKDNIIVRDMNVLMIKILNAPAFVTNEKLVFYTRENNHDAIFFEHPDYKDRLYYPLDNNQITINTDRNILNHEIAEKIYPKILIRKVRIEYQWISDDTLKYFFESEWQYNIKNHDWDLVSQNAD
jgi:hypothetical protein